MHGVQMIDHIFELEAKIFEFIARRLPHSGIFALDIAAAFPSLSRRYLLWVLRRMRIPARLYNLIRQLHEDSLAFICFRNKLFHQILSSAGVKQDDPSAMQLFILGYDPLIRFISFSLGPTDHLLLPYCDDLALAVLDVVSAWSIIIRCFDIIRKIASLALNCDKTQFLLTDDLHYEEDKRAICNLDSIVTSAQFGRSIKYLGIFLGFDAMSLNWDAVCPDFVATAKFIGSLDCGLTTKISLYNMLAISKLSYVATFFPPTRAALLAENRAVQLVSKGPWNAFPPRRLSPSSCLGFPINAVTSALFALPLRCVSLPRPLLLSLGIWLICGILRNMGI